MPDPDTASVALALDGAVAAALLTAGGAEAPAAPNVVSGAATPAEVTVVGLPSALTFQASVNAAAGGAVTVGRVAAAINRGAIAAAFHAIDAALGPGPGPLTTPGATEDIHAASAAGTSRMAAAVLRPENTLRASITPCRNHTKHANANADAEADVDAGT